MKISSLAFIVIFFAVAIAACKKDADKVEQLNKQKRSLTSTVERDASAVKELGTAADFFFRIWNKPYEVSLGKLPTSGEAELKPFSGYWYPEVTGGTNVGGALSRYDQAFNGSKTPASDWERANHTRPKSDPDSGWAGHCNGFSASAQRHAEPKESVTVNGVRFSPNDIKAMLAEIYMSAKSVFIGGQRCGTATNPCTPSGPNNRSDPEKMSTYEDVNPATLHLALGNWIGRFKHTIVFDEKHDREVWNYPLYKYNAVVTPLSGGESEASRYVTGQTAASYKFNPAATKFVLVDTKVTFANASGGEAPAGSYPNHEAKLIDYQYILELNDNDEVIGGEWTTKSQNNHPDFVWVALDPFENRTGDRRYGNPNIDPARVIRLWARSVGQDPENPKLDIVEPVWQSNWGRFSSFTIELDEAKSGAVYLGKKIKMNIDRSGRLAEAVTLEVGLNDKVVKTLNDDGAAKFALEIDPKPGLNRLAFIWKQEGVDDYQAFVRFVALP